MALPQFVGRNIAYICDPNQAGNAIKPNSDGSINVDITGGTGGTISTKPASLASAGAGQFALSIPSTGSAVALTPPAGAVSAQITVSGANIRYADDGTSPTTSVGMPVYQASSWFYSGPLSAIKFYAQSGTATLDVLYYK